MKIDNNGAKLTLLCAAVFTLSVTALFFIAFLAENKSIKNLLLITSPHNGFAGVNIDSIEEFTQTDFLITYEIKSPDRISLLYDDYLVTVIATNSCYKQIKKHNMIEGSFFTGQAWTEKQKHAVLNETAALEIFGSVNIIGRLFKMKNETWLVSGVINDKDENSRIYIPSSITGGSVNNFLVLLSVFTGYDETYIKDSLKSLGIYGTSYDFINLDNQRNYLYERVYIILLFLSSLIFIFLMFIFINKFVKAFSVLKTELSSYYIDQVFRQIKKIILRPVWFGFLLLLSPVIALWLFLKAVSIVLPWQDIISLKDKREVFYPYIEILYNFETASFFVFIFSLIFLTFSVILLIRRYYAIFKF